MRALHAAVMPAVDETTADDPLLRFRFEIPDCPPFVVTRPRLTALLERGDAPVTLVVGPPGSGKTQLVASWAAGARTTGAVAWITLDDDDRTCPFWTVVVGCVQFVVAVYGAQPNWRG